MARITRGTNRRKARAVAIAAACLTLMACNVPKDDPTADRAKLAQDADAYYAKFIAARAACEAAGPGVKKALGQSDMTLTYQALKIAEDACGQSLLAVHNLTPPEGVDDTQKQAFIDARNFCETAYSRHGDAYKAFATLVDGDDRPSLRAKAREASDDAAAATPVCEDAVAKAVRGAGGTVVETNPPT